ncbi:hypothetical protein IFM89_015180 [Coptis chinensis]|uniref:Uncharacterized protein n=1 Tax=Coptis chinensis TaxID=261450 RepID=A0A835LB07_9MAGN|nr:hypothetical protein IFM89_015180 [Coptis chinensis]
MASMLSENVNVLPYNDLEFEGMEIIETDVFLMEKLLEESQIEDTEDERLGSVMQSLEAEINQSKDVLLESTHDCFGYSASNNIYDSLDWTDMEMASTSFTDDIGKWYAYSMENEVVGVVGFGDNNNADIALSQTCEHFGDYSQFCHADDLVYCSLWQETYDTVMYF